jgi:phosphoribosylaminoimidazolecarboxamide formyltransferase/IMP cyclohydrolase
MASDAFFPFQIVSISKKKWHNSSNTTRRILKDQLSIDYCNENKLAMVFTGTRHFKTLTLLALIFFFNFKTPKNIYGIF